MYADFGTVSFPAMSSNSEPSTPGKSSGAVQSGSPPRPTSGPLDVSEIWDPEGEDGGSSGVETGEHGGGADRAPEAGDDGLQEEVAESSGAGQEESTTEAGEGVGVDRYGDGDDGYHTPTSPRCRIPADLPCPPAPRKIPANQRRRKRNLGVQEIYRVVRRRILWSGEFELVLRPVVDCPPAGRVDNGAAGEGDVVG